MIILAGFPAITTLFSNDFVTTLPAPTTTLSPNTTPGKIVTPPPSQTLFPIWIGAPYSNPEFLSIGSRGWSGGEELTVWAKHTVIANTNFTNI